MSRKLIGLRDIRREPSCEILDEITPAVTHVRPTRGGQIGGMIQGFLILL